jgi:hypothetical protein
MLYTTCSTYYCTSSASAHGVPMSRSLSLYIPCCAMSCAVSLLPSLRVTTLRYRCTCSRTPGSRFHVDIQRAMPSDCTFGFKFTSNGLPWQHSHCPPVAACLCAPTQNECVNRVHMFSRHVYPGNICTWQPRARVAACRARMPTSPITLPLVPTRMARTWGPGECAVILFNHTAVVTMRSHDRPEGCAPL